MHFRTLLAVGSMALWLFPATGCNRERESKAPPTGREAELLAEGKTLFGRNCAQCHGERGWGGRMAPGLRAGRDFRYGDSREEIARTVREGRPFGMPAFGPTLSEREIEALAAYVTALRRRR